MTTGRKMTANTTVDILKYTVAATPKTSGSKSSETNSFADKSGNFTSILDTVKKNYAAQDSSARNSNDANNLSATATNKNTTQNANTTTAKTTNNKVDADNNNTQNDSKTDNNTDSTNKTTNAQDSVTNNTKDTEKKIASAEAKTDAAQATAEEIDAKTAAAANNAAKNEKAASDLKTVIDKNAADKTKADGEVNTKILENAKDEKAIADKNAILETQADDCVKQNQVTNANATALETVATNGTDTKTKNQSDSVDENEKADNAENDAESSTKTGANTQPAIDLTTLNLAKAVENIIVSLPQSVNTANDKQTDESITNIQSAQTTNKSAQEDLNINVNGQLNQIKDQITSSRDITAKELTNVNIPSNIQLNNQQVESEEIIGQQAEVQAEALDAQNTNVDTPTIKVSTEAVVSDINLNSQIKDTSERQNVKNTTVTQEIIDKTNAKITSVQSESSSDSSSNNLLNKQHAGEQAIKFAIENDRNDKENKQNITQTIDASTQNINLTSITASSAQTQPTSSTNFAKTLEGVQTAVETPKELNKSDILSQINNKLGDLKDEGTTKINIILRPENLGKLNLELVTSKEGLTAQITADSAHVKELLDKNLDSLKDTLGSQGVNVNNVSVKVAESPKQDATNYFEQQSQQQQQSNNKQSNGQGFSFKEETNNFFDATETSSESEDLTEESTGKIDYKV